MKVLGELSDQDTMMNLRNATVVKMKKKKEMTNYCRYMTLKEDNQDNE